MTEPVATAELTPALKAGKIALTQKNADLVTVARALAGAASRALEKPAEAKPPAPIVLSDEQRQALDLVASYAESMTLPAAVRKLNEGERANLLAARAVFDAAAKVIADSKDAIREAVFNHFDKIAEAEGRVDETTPMDKAGHYILEDKEDKAHGGAPGMETRFTRETRAGAVRFGTPQTEADALKALVDQDLLPKDVYLKVTRQTRIVDEHALFEAMKADEALIPIIEQALTVSPDTASLNVRKA